MTVPITLSNLVNLENETTAVTLINSNSTAIATAFGESLYTSGDTMFGSLNMNSNQIINLPAPSTTSSPVRLQDVSILNGGGTIPYSAWSNIITSKVGNYTLQNSDKSFTVSLGGNAFYTLTVNVSSGYDANFAVMIANTDSTRGKLISINGYNSFVLWPNQSFLLFNQNGWQFNPPGKWQAPGNITLNVSHSSGSDTNNDGLGTGSGAFATVYNAYTVAQTYMNVGGSGVLTIQVLDTNFTETPTAAFLGPSTQGGGSGGVIFIIGNQASPPSCVWNTGGLIFDDGAVVSIRGFKFIDISSGHTAITVDKNGLVVFANLEFGTFSGGAHMQTFNGGNLVWDSGTYTVSGTANYHILNNSGNVNITLTGPISVPNALTMTGWYYGQRSGSSGIFSTSFSGTGSGSGSVGTKYNVNLNATLQLFGTTLPGATAGVTSSGGQVTA